MTGSVIETPPFGPVDLYLLGLPGERPDPAALSALTELTGSGLLRLLDLLLISRSDAGETTIVEAAEIPGGFEIGAAGLGAAGLIGNEDVDDLAALIPEGTAALLVAVELVYQRDLAEKTAASGAELLAYERIPAPVVNALLDSFVAEMEN
ncbi:hypothetical protein RL72_00956 [Microbacterium azadirachtae]|uniref:DUF1269 domain-containing protein n=1 Tax=Microbacterium azadirachtae TaxID=582680 RepID=A0A0F0L1Q9_9MICO|nr:DUF6325 family protein [Microbacterium azadirachtae]KJL26624.1 hypothetical protein RL72_00956 [Microbacterium azadirachtae]